MDRGAWRVTVHRLTKSQTRLSNKRHNGIPMTAEAQQHILLLTIVEAEKSKIKMQIALVFGEGLLPGLQAAIFSYIFIWSFLVQA